MSQRRRTREIIAGLGLSHGVSSKERLRLILLFLMMAVVTIALAGGMDSLFAGLKRSDPPAPIEEPGPESRPIEIDDQVIKWEPDPGFFDRIVSEASSADRIREYPDALRVLAEMTRRRPHLHFLLDPALKDERGFLTPKPSAVLADPKAYRAKPLEFNGVLEQAELVDTKVEFGVDLNYDYSSQWTGRIRLDGEDGPGPVVSFLFLDDGAGSEVARDFTGRRVKIQGVFYRLRDVRSGEGYETTIFMLGKKLTRAIDVPIIKDAAVAAARIRDETRDDQRIVYDDGFYGAVGYAFGNPVETVLGTTPPRAIASLEGWESANELRLKPVRVKGAVLQIRYEPFETGGEKFDYVRPTDAIAKGWYTTYLGTLDAEAIYVLGTLERPTGISVGSRIEADGVLVKRLAYDNRGTARPDEAPQDYDPNKHGVTRSVILLCPAPFREIEPPDAGQSTQTKVVVISVAIVLAGLFALLVTRDGAAGRALGAKLRGGRSKRLRTAGVDLNEVARKRRGAP